MAAGNHDIQAVFIDSILKQANITLESLPSFIQKLIKISSENNIDFYLSVSADKNEIPDIDSLECTVLWYPDSTKKSCRIFLLYMATEKSIGISLL